MDTIHLFIYTVTAGNLNIKIKIIQNVFDTNNDCSLFIILMNLNLDRLY